jgi:hypothetical protein
LENSPSLYICYSCIDNNKKFENFLKKYDELISAQKKQHQEQQLKQPE